MLILCVEFGFINLFMFISNVNPFARLFYQVFMQPGRKIVN